MNRRRPALASAFDPKLSRLVGSTFVHRLTDHAHAPLIIGSDRWTVHDLVTLCGVGNFRAARILSTEVKRIGGVKNLRHLYETTSPHTFTLRGVAETTLYVLWRVFQSRGLDPDAWAGDIDVSFSSMKRRDQKAEKRTRDDQRRRNRRAARTAHETAVSHVLQ